MIVKMLKTYAVARGQERDCLLDALRDLGVMHLAPVQPEQAEAEEQTLTGIDHLGRAIQILSTITPAGEKPQISPMEAAEEAIRIHRESAEQRARLSTLFRQVAQLAMWGDVRLADFEELRNAGVDVRFFSILREDTDAIEAQLVHVVEELSGKRALVAVIGLDEEAEFPEQAEPLELPAQDRPSIRAQAAEIDAKLQRDTERLTELAHLVDEMQAEHTRLGQEAQFTVAQRSGLADEHLFGVQGWVPAEKAEMLSAELAERGIEAAVDTREPDEEDTPPTLIRYPAWARPIKGLFDVLGTVAGYKESDVSAPFMIALPIFAAMLIGDGGYGAILLLAPLVFRKKATELFGKEFATLLSVIGGVALAWGFLCASFFGVLLYEPIIPVNMSDGSRSLVMRISFFMAAIHLTVAQVWRGVSFWPSLKSLAPIGWAIFVWGMLGVVKYFVLNDPIDLETPWPYLLAVGAVLAILFEHPCKNPVKMLGLGLANFPLSMLSAFSDVISYVRLMAVGLASSVLATSFNELALSSGSWFIAVPVLIFGHGLNLGLALIALFAHGVRLNMLEFSNNLGLQWAGYQYEPFTKQSH